MKPRSASATKAWTRSTLERAEWLLQFPEQCIEELKETARILDRNPLHPYLLDPDDYPSEATRAEPAALFGFLASRKARSPRPRRRMPGSRLGSEDPVRLQAIAFLEVQHVRIAQLLEACTNRQAAVRQLGGIPG